MTPSTGEVRLVLIPEAIDQAPLQFEEGDIMELP